MNRAYSRLSIKTVSDAGGQRRFTGIASTITADRMDDIVMPRGAKFKLPLPLLFQHNAREPIGWVRAARVSDTQIEVDCELHNEKDPGRLKDRLDEAWHTIRAGLIQGLSIGFDPKKYEPIKGSYGFKIDEWEWLELSTVTIPAQAEANIQTIKSFDERQRAALGHKADPPVERSRPGAAGHPERAASSGGFSFSRGHKGDNTMKTIKELREARSAKHARMKELVELFEQADHDTTDEETAEYDGLKADISQLDKDIRIAEFHQMNASAAKGVDGSSSERAAASRSGMSFVRKQDPDDKFKGQSYIRGVIAKLLAYNAGPGASPSAMAQARWGKSHPNLCMWIKANEVPAGGTDAGEWGSELVAVDGRFTGDFLEYLYGMTVFDRLPLRRVPANIAIKGQDGAATGYWVGQSKGIPMSNAGFSSVDLRPLKVAALTAASNEWFEDATPDGEQLLRDALGEASAQRIDQTFLSDAAAVPGVSPAGILNGVTAIPSTGTDADAVRADISALYAPFIAAKNSSGLYFVSTPTVVKSLQLMRNALGQREFDTVAAGTLEGDTLVNGDNVADGNLILLKPSDIWRIGDTGVRVEVSREAMIEQSTAPTGATDTPVAASQYFTSMFQEESTAIKIVRRINFGKRRPGSVQYVSGASYGASATT